MRIERQQQALEGHANPVLCCTYSAAQGAAPLVASGCEDGRICLHDIAESRLAHRLQAGSEDDAVSSLACHPSDPNLLYAAVGSEVKLIDLRTGPGVACSHSINKDEVNQVAINAKGTHLAAADDAGDVQVLDLASGKIFKSIQGAQSNIASCVSFRAHRPWELVTAGFDQTVARWDFSRGKCLSRVWMEVEADAEGEAKLFNPPMVHCLAVPSTSSRPWCQFVAAARGDGTVEVFDADAQPSSNNSSKAKGPNPAQAAAREGGQGPSQSWRGPLLLTRARGGHTRPASAVCFLGRLLLLQIQGWVQRWERVRTALGAPSAATQAREHPRTC